MGLRGGIAAALVACALAAPAQAGSGGGNAHAAIRVEAVQYPAWLERGGYSVPITPGTALRASDTLRTGADARVELKLAEGSTFKLGQNARFTVEKVQDRGIFRSVLHVVLGAMRFTTGALGIGRKRDIAIQVRTLTAGVRGTDLWGRSSDERDLICLLDGRISVAADDRAPITLDSPRDFYQRARGQEPEKGRVDEAQVAKWSQETEMQSDGPVARVGGTWSVIASKYYGRDDALAVSRTLRARGYPAVVVSVDRYQYVEIRGLTGEAEARALMSRIRDVPGVNIPSVSRTGR
jgi:hypothetical protein